MEVWESYIYNKLDHLPTSVNVLRINVKLKEIYLSDTECLYNIGLTGTMTCFSEVVTVK